MANKFNGQVTLPSGKLMVLDFNALVNLEQMTGRRAMEVFADFDNGNMNFSDIRTLFYVCLKRHCPDITIDEAGDEVDFEVIPELFAAAIPTGNSDGGNETKPKVTRRK